MKQIIVKSCGMCPFIIGRGSDFYAESTVHECTHPKNKDKVVGRFTIHPDCPLDEKLSKEEAMGILGNWDDVKGNQLAILDVINLLNVLGFTKKEGK